MKPTPHKLTKKSQRGAALVIGLLLLLVLTVLAISGMNSASVEFLMAGNDQFRQNAFQASETGIEQALVVGNFNPGVAVAPLIAGPVPGSATDSYNAQVQLQLGGCTLPVYGSSAGTVNAYQYDITSTGTSTRNSTALHTQGVQVIAPLGSGGYFTGTCGGAGGGLN
jgi:type IV pilus assembly protein PilX